MAPKNNRDTYATVEEYGEKKRRDESAANIEGRKGRLQTEERAMNDFASDKERERKKKSFQPGR